MFSTSMMDLLFDKQIALCLSQNTSICACKIPKSLIKPCIQVTFLKASITTIYSASVVDNAIVDCNVECQQTGPPAIVNKYPVVDRRLSNHQRIIRIHITNYMVFKIKHFLFLKFNTNVNSTKNKRKIND